MSQACATPSPCKVAGDLSGMEVPFHSSSRQRPCRQDWAAGGQPVQADSPLEEPRALQLPGAPQGPHGACRNLVPALRRWQEVEDSSDEFLKFILMDYVACPCNVVDISLGEEALDLRVVLGTDIG